MNEANKRKTYSIIQTCTLASCCNRLLASDKTPRKSFTFPRTEEMTRNNLRTICYNNIKFWFTNTFTVRGCSCNAFCLKHNDIPSQQLLQHEQRSNIKGAASHSLPCSIILANYITTSSPTPCFFMLKRNRNKKPYKL